MLYTEPTKVYYQLQLATEPPSVWTKEYWMSMWKREASHNTKDQWLVNLRADHIDSPEHDPVTTTVGDSNKECQE